MTDTITKDSQAGILSSSRHFVMIWLLGMLVLLPVKIFHFPFNMELMDFWIFMALPIFLLTYSARRQTLVSWAYTPVIIFIFAVSFISVFAAPNPSKGLIVIAKEIYLFIWFLMMTAFLSTLNERDMRRVMVIWSAVAVLHGLFIIAQFLSPALWQFTKSITGNVEVYDHYRSPGLFPNANAAAFSQLMGFVPVVLARYSPPVAIGLGICIFLSILGTGSMGATLGALLGLAVALFTILVLTKKKITIPKYFGPLFAVMIVVGGAFLFVVSQNEVYQKRLESIVFGRADRSSGGRFNLWERGVDVFLEHSGFFWGVGPENFREIDGKDKQLHNDFLAFAVERGLLSVIALAMFGAIAFSRALYLFRTCMVGSSLTVVVFMSAVVAMLFESLTHQIFHYRELWVVLAAQEAMIFKRQQLLQMNEKGE
jgi:O-antigen ligase